MAGPVTPSERVLRIAVLTDDAVSTELHQTKAEGVTAGTHYKSDLLLTGDAAPLRHKLFDVRAGTYVLDLPPTAKGKLRIGGKAVTCSTLRKRFATGNVVRVPLDPKARGKLVLGESTIVFQFARPKRVPPKLPFPAIFRASILGTLGGLYLYSQLASTLTLGPVFVYLGLTEVPEEQELDVDERFLVAMGVPLDKKDEPPEEEEEELPPEENDFKQKDETLVKEETKPQPKLTETPQNFSEKAMSEARSVGVARVLGTYGGPGEGTVFDVISTTENNLGELFKMGMTTTVLADGGPIGDFVPGGEGISLRGSSVNTMGFETGGGPALAEKDGKRERVVKSIVKASTQQISGGGDSNALRATLNHRIRGLNSCYETALRVDSSLSAGGTHTYTIAISVMGTVTSVSLEEDTLGSDKVTACAKARIKGWRFPMENAEDAAELTFNVVYKEA